MHNTSLASTDDNVLLHHYDTGLLLGISWKKPGLIEKGKE